MNNASIINHNADLAQVSHFTSTTLGPAYNEFRYIEHPVITIFIKIIDSNVKKSSGKTNTRLYGTPVYNEHPVITNRFPCLKIIVSNVLKFGFLSII